MPTLPLNGTGEELSRSCPWQAIRPEFSFQVLLPAIETGLSRDSKAQPEQIRAVDVTTIGDRVGLV